MTQFVQGFSTDQLLPPWVSEGARNWVFAIKVPPHCLQRFLDSHFNCAAPDVAPYYYEALDSPYGLLRVTKHDNFSSAHTGKPGFHTLRKIDVNWSYPVHRWHVSKDNIRYKREIVWVEPMAFDNNSFSMFSSREIWGTESDMARISIEEKTHPDRMHVDVAMQGLRTFTPKSISHLIGVMHIEMDPEVESDLVTVFDKHPGLATWVGVLLSSVGMKGAQPGVHNSEVNTLKQFRDIFNMAVAVYRAIIASRTNQSEVTDLKFYDGDSVSLDFMWSETMDESLRDFFGIDYRGMKNVPEGHPHGAQTIDKREVDWHLPRLPVEVALAASFTSDITYDILRTLHTYGG